MKDEGKAEPSFLTLSSFRLYPSSLLLSFCSLFGGGDHTFQSFNLLLKCFAGHGACVEVGAIERASGSGLARLSVSGNSIGRKVCWRFGSGGGRGRRCCRTQRYG